MAEQITTAVELDALPVGSVVVNTYGSAWQKNGRNWYRAGASSGRKLAPFPPFVVVYRPDRDLLGEARAEGAREALQIVDEAAWLKHPLDTDDSDGDREYGRALDDAVHALHAYLTGGAS
jgi:hypothetical protein